MQNRSNQRIITGALSVAVALLAGTTSHAEDYYWSNAAGDNNYMNTNNWITNGVSSASLPSVSGDSAAINTNGTDKCTVVDGQTAPNINEYRIGYAGDGEVEQTGGSVTATRNASRYTKIGWNGYDGLYTLSGGTASLNALRIGAGGGTGTMLIDGGGLDIARAYGDSSILISASSGSTGLVEIASGSLQTRGGVVIQDAGTFSVKGGDPTLIGIGSSGSGDGYWTQRAGGTLKVQVATNGLTSILVDEVDGDTNASWNGIATFELGSELDVSFLDGHMETNYWTVMTAEGGIVDNGLKFASGVDSNNWNFELVEGDTMLVVGYGGATYVPPPAGTNLFVNAIVDTPDTWNLYAPEGGTTALSDQSSDGFTVNIDTVTNWLDRPVVAQEFGIDKDLSEVGQALSVSFDVEVLDAVSAANGEDFRFAFYDTNQNCQIIAGMIDFGPPGGTTMKIRVENKVSLSNPSDDSEDPAFYSWVPGDYAGLCNGSKTLGQASGFPGNGLQNVGEVIQMEATITRTASNEVGVVTSWSDSAGSNTVTCIASINEDAPVDSEGMPVSGKYGVFNGFGFKIFADAPFIGAGRYKVSNYEVSYTAALQNGFSYNVSQIVVDASGDVTLTLSNPVIGAAYTVLGTQRLATIAPMTTIGTYVVESPGIITVPAADVADNRFFDVALPVTEVTYD